MFRSEQSFGNLEQCTDRESCAEAAWLLPTHERPDACSPPASAIAAKRRRLHRRRSRCGKAQTLLHKSWQRPSIAELAVALAPLATKPGRLAADSAVRVLQAAGLSQSAIGPPPSSGTVPAEASSQAPAGTDAPWSQTHSGSKHRTGLWMAAGTSVAITSPEVRSTWRHWDSEMIRAPRFAQPGGTGGTMMNACWVSSTAPVAKSRISILAPNAAEVTRA